MDNNKFDGKKLNVQLFDERKFSFCNIAVIIFGVFTISLVHTGSLFNLNCKKIDKICMKN